MTKYKYKKLEWEMHAKKKQFQNTVKKSIEIIEASQNIGNMVLSMSGGKDSVAMTHLVKHIFPNAKIMTQFDDCDWEEKRPYINSLKDKYGWEINEVIPHFSVWEMACESNIGYDCICAKSHRMTKELFIEPLENKRKELNCIGSYIGLRADESKGRATNYYVRGHTYQTKDYVWHCLPIAHWKTIDVFAYLTSREVPINPCYFNNAFFAPEDIRISWALPSPTGIRYGDMQHLKKYHPIQANKLKIKFNL